MKRPVFRWCPVGWMYVTENLILISWRKQNIFYYYYRKLLLLQKVIITTESYYYYRKITH